MSPQDIDLLYFAASYVVVAVVAGLVTYETMKPILWIRGFREGQRKTVDRYDHRAKVDAK